MRRNAARFIYALPLCVGYFCVGELIPFENMQRRIVKLFRGWMRMSGTPRCYRPTNDLGRSSAVSTV